MKLPLINSNPQNMNRLGGNRDEHGFSMSSRLAVVIWRLWGWSTDTWERGGVVPVFSRPWATYGSCWSAQLFWGVSPEEDEQNTLGTKRTWLPRDAIPVFHGSFSSWDGTAYRRWKARSCLEIRCWCTVSPSLHQNSLRRNSLTFILHIFCMFCSGW